MGVRDGLVHHEGAAYIGQVDWINLAFAERTVSVLEQPWADARRVEEVVYVARNTEFILQAWLGV